MNVSDQGPNAVDDLRTTLPATPVEIDVLTNDSDPQGQPLTIVSTTPPSNGVISVNDGGTPADPSDDTITYTPNVGFLGTDTFTYTIQDSDGNQDTATVTVIVADQVPDAVDDRAVTPPSTPVAIDVLANDSDPQNQPLTIVSTTPPSNGSVVIDDGGTPGDPSDDTITYTPNPGFTGTDTFTYTIQDPDGNQDTATVTVLVGDFVPDAVDDVETTAQGVPVLVDVLANDTDPNNDPLTIVSFTQPADGVAELDDGGTPNDPSDDQILYTPDPTFAGIDTFTYTIEDPDGSQDTATVTITVTEPAGIQGTVFLDPNHDNIQQDDEEGQIDWTIEFLDATGAVVSKSSTNDEGEFRVEPVAAGHGSLARLPPSGHQHRLGGDHRHLAL